MTELEKFNHLGISLPEAINSYKFYGDFDGEIRAIDAYLNRDDIPEALKVRLRLEKTIARGMKHEYTVTEQEALEELSKRFEGFTREKLCRMMDSGILEWRFIMGEKRLSNFYLSSLSGKLKELFCSKIEKPTDNPTEKVKLIRAAIDEMREKGYAKRRVRIRQELRIVKGSERVGEMIKVHLPFPLECEEQTDISLIACSHPCRVGGEGQRTVYIETALKADEIFFVEYEYTICMKYKKLDFNTKSFVKPDFMTDEQPPHIVFTPLIRETAKEIVKEEKDPLKKAKLIYDYVTKNLRYSYMREYLLIENIPEFALTATVGDCGVMALLFITLCRAVGVPAGWQSGLSVTPLRVGSHDWAKFYIEPYGMLHADLSSGEDAWEKGDMKRHEFFFGNVDPFRMIANNELQTEFDPPKAHCRIDPYDNQSGEAEYADRGLTDPETRTAKILLGFDKID